MDSWGIAAIAVAVTFVAAAQAQQPNGEWPLPGHDNRHTGQAELPCDMAEAPTEIWSYNLGTIPVDSAICVDVDGDGEDEVIYGASPLVCKRL